MPQATRRWISEKVKSLPQSNVAVEIGFMKALNKRVLILKDVALARLHIDLIHLLYCNVDFSDLGTVEGEVTKWLDDLPKS